MAPTLAHASPSPTAGSSATSAPKKGEKQTPLHVKMLITRHRGPVRARSATKDERDRLWKRWAEIDTGLDAYAASRSAVTPVVVLEPREDLPNKTG